VADRHTREEFGGTGQTPLRMDLTWTDRDQLDSLTRWRDLLGTQKVGSTVYGYNSFGDLTNLASSF